MHKKLTLMASTEKPKRFLLYELIVKLIKHNALYVYPILLFFVHTLFLSNIISPICRYPINEHKGNPANNLGIYFEREICVDDFNTNEDVNDCVLPSDLLKLVE